LDNGIDNVTKERIADESGLSRKTLDRYFPTKTDCVLRVMDWLLTDISDSIMAHYPYSIFTDGEHSGADILRMYFEDLKKLFFGEPKICILYGEYRAYICRNAEVYEQGYGEFWNKIGGHRLREKIYALGYKDGSIMLEGLVGSDFHFVEVYFCNAFLGFLSNLAVSFNQYSRDEVESLFDRYANDILRLYTNLPPEKYL
jgi:AcrR family transcriptional regulator